MTIFLRAFFKFGVKDAIIISNATIAISGLIRYVLNFRKNHPLKVDTNGQPAGLLVDYNVCVVMLPMAIVGSALGAILSLILPEPITISILMASLMYIGITTTVKLYKICKSENAQRFKAKNERNIAEPEKIICELPSINIIPLDSKNINQ